MNLTIGFSPCPNDTFIFDALVNGLIDTEGLQFEPVLEDVETLNRWALAGKLDISKLSFPAFFQSLDDYVLLNAGSALGKGVGPLLVSKTEKLKSKIENAVVALPGANTTANLLFSFAYPDAKNKIFLRYDQIEDFVLSATSNSSIPGGNSEEVLGVIIHENRFTYQQKGLHKLRDLGIYWEEQMKTPIPLGGIAIKRSIDKKLSRQVDGLIKKSLAFAFQHYPLITEYVKRHAQAMSEAVMRQHIDLYVNNYSLALGEEGQKAIGTLYDVFGASGNHNKSGQSLFL